jgi:hypothetical protein
MEMKLAPASAATALATRVFPHPDSGKVWKGYCEEVRTTRVKPLRMREPQRFKRLSLKSLLESQDRGPPALSAKPLLLLHTWRSVQQHPGRRGQTHGLESLRVLDGLGDSKRQLLTDLKCGPDKKIRT